jgi:hypothetical protein
MTDYSTQAHLYAEQYMQNLSAQVAEKARADAEPKKIKYVVEPLPCPTSIDQREWRVYRVNEVGMYTHVSNYDHRAPAERVAEALNHWASEESTS